ncbi:Sec1 family protein (macronuclear) [Tetrahymena thermophila SB210]|uniref:Sec1 family protein n=1 Tax=Tetrahymena thermophila (strain SB210) TaxID=312017 RepID=Q23FZ0_TETTS|nr:Sec1 family protein [Tetrahymena thermophila SB210]EAR95470.2 Sec1 family protein [Tetrahymena thermophila SB210]|eukprot:XP_001015715.2 Sec1 family protein [Tetrahymena thermophila SB210]
MNGNYNMNFQDDSVQQYVHYFSKINKAKLFYFRIVPKMLNSFLRSKAISIGLLILNTLQESSLVIIANTDFEDSEQSYTNDIINSLDYFNFKYDTQNSFSNFTKYSVFYFSFIYNSLLILLMSIACLIYRHNQYRSHDIKGFCYFYSLAVKIYNYLFYIPFLFNSIEIIQNSDFSSISYLGYINAIFTIFIGIILNYHDFDYTFVVKDFLSRRESKYDIGRQLFMSLVIILNYVMNQKLQSITMFIYSIVKLIIYHKEFLYTHEDISFIYQTLNSILASFSIVILVYFNITSDNPFLLMIVCSPLCYKLCMFKQQKIFSNIFYECIGKTNLNHIPLLHLDIYVRQLKKNLNFFYEDYIEKGQALIFENIYINHTLECEINSYKCFCFEFKRDEDTFNLEEYIGQEYRRKYVIFYVVDLFEKFIDNKIKKKQHTSSAMFAYISFVTEIMKISTKSFSEIYSYQSKLIKIGASMHDMYYTQILLTRCNHQFQQFFKNAVIQNQRLYMMSMVVFDEQFDDFKKKLHSYLIKIAEFFDYLCSNFLDLKELEQKSKKLYDDNQQILSLIKLLYDLNPESKQLNFLTTIYNSVLDFENRKITELIKKSKRLPSQNLLPSEKFIKVFTKSSCVVYASLNTIDGKITKVSKSFKEVYDIDNKVILGKTINQLIPKGLYGAHDDFMKNFRNKGTMNVIKIGERLVFGLNGRGFIIPLMIRLKLENMFGEFGVCSHLRKVNQEKDYLFFSNEGNILDISENLFKTVFQQMISLNDLRLLNMNHIIPIIFGIQKLEQFEETFYSILVVKKHSNSKRLQQTHTAVDSLQMIEKIVNNIKPSDIIYNIAFKMSLIPTSLHVTFKFIEITSFQKESVKRKKIDSINQLKQCIQIFTDFEKEDVINHELLSTKLKNDGQQKFYMNNDELTEVQSSNSQSQAYSINQQGTILTDSKQLQHAQSIFKQQQLRIPLEKNEVDQILSPIAKQSTMIIPIDMPERHIVQEGNGLNQSTEIQTRRETVGAILENKQEHDQNSLIQKYQSDITYPSPRYQHEFNFQPKDMYNMLSPKESHRSLISPRSQFEEINLNRGLKQIDYNLLVKIRPETRISSLKKIEQIPETDNIQENQSDFMKEQQNSYKQIIFNQLNQQQKIQRVKAHEKSITNSQYTLKNYNDSMKQIQSKAQIEEEAQKVIKQNKKDKEENSKSSKFSSNSIIQDENEAKKEEQHEISSLRSSNYSIQEQKKRLIIKKIYSKQDTGGLKFFIFTGIASFSLLLILTIVQFQQINSTFTLYNTNFNTLDLFNSALFDILRSLSNESYTLLLKLSLNLFQPDIQQSEYTIAQKDFKGYSQNLKLLYSDIQNLDTSLTYQSDLQTPTSLTVLGEGTFFTVQIPNLYLLVNVASLLSTMQNDISDQNDLIEIWTNFMTIYTNISQLQKEVQQFAQSKFNYILDMMYANLFVFLGVSVFISFTLVPLSILIKKQKEKILKLFGSFSPEKIQKYVDLIEYCLFNMEMAELSNSNISKMNKAIHKINKEIQSIAEKQTQENSSNGDKTNKRNNFFPRQNGVSSNQRPRILSTQSNQNGSLKSNQIQTTYIKRLPQKRNRSIASFTSLPKLDKFILLVTLFIVLILMIFPTISLVITNNFINECNVIVQQRITMLNLQKYMFSSQANHYSIWMFAYFGQDDDFINKMISFNYDQIMNQLQPQSNQEMDSLQQLIGQEGDFNYDSSHYHNFFIELLNDNICSTAEIYPQYFNQDIKTMVCKNYSQGIFNQGLILSIKKMIYTFSTLTFYYKPNFLGIQQLVPFLIQQQQQNYFISDLNDSIRYLGYICDGMDNFLVSYQKNYYNSLFTRQTVIFVSQIVMITLVYSITWNILYRRLKRDLTKSKNLLTLFHINLIMENNLFLQYLKQNKFGEGN